MYRRVLIARCVAGLLVGLSPAGHGTAAEAGPEGPPAAIELTGNASPELPAVPMQRD
jgi:hypothetical protein